MFKLILPVLLTFFLCQFVLGQTVNDCSYKPPREGETWCFYSSIKLQFHAGSVTQSALPPVLPFGKGCASISDAEGNLLLFTDGMKLWDKNANLLSNTLEGDLGSSQSSLLVPKPLANKQYYIFTVDHLLYPAPIFTKGLNYSFIDLSATAALDTLPVKKLLDETPEKITGVKHANGIDYWVVAHGWNSNSFYSYMVTNAGVDSLPVISNVGMVQAGTFSSNTSVGYMKLSTDGSRLAHAILGAKMVEWFDFDNTSGIVSTARQITSPDLGSPYGIEFSPDSRYLYFTTVNTTTNATNNLYQVDLSAGSAPVLINQLPLDLTALQLSVDGKIYAARYKQPFLGVIENPNRPGTACNLAENGLNINGSLAPRGLPNFIQSYFDIPAVTYDTKCMGDDTYMYLTNSSNIDSISWNFGDPASGTSNTDNSLQPFHVFSTSGTYTIKATEYFNGLSFDTPATIKINKLPPKSFASFSDSIYILPGSAVLLDGGALMKSYLWQDGSMLQQFEVSQPGYYTVSIIDTNCCLQSDTLKVLLLDLVVPSAFTPNHDGLNDRFAVKGPTEGIENYHFYIYNRWGQLMWETNSFFDSWDGTFNGADCPTGVFVWTMKFSVSGNLLNRDKVVKRGVLTLLR